MTSAMRMLARHAGRTATSYTAAMERRYRMLFILAVASALASPMRADALPARAPGPPVPDVVGSKGTGSVHVLIVDQATSLQLGALPTTGGRTIPISR